MAEHHALVGQGIGDVARCAVHGEGGAAQRLQLEAGGGDHDIGLQQLATVQPDAAGFKAGNRIGDDLGLAGPNRIKQIGIRHQAQPLIPKCLAMS